MLWKGFQKPKRLACNVDTLTDKYGQFNAQPFERESSRFDPSRNPIER